MDSENNPDHGYELINKAIAFETDDRQKVLLKQLPNKVKLYVDFMSREESKQPDVSGVVIKGFLDFISTIKNKAAVIKILQGFAELHPEWRASLLRLVENINT